MIRCGRCAPVGLRRSRRGAARAPHRHPPHAGGARPIACDA
ncbi:hypothetical protein BMA10247_A2396 [Burkholderia mallei NCTC 10247]|nr:hypothetical protein BMA10247_A2396 [Burkholderia mallei NCTC 10247]EBA46864.1 hypothetical protein BURPS305_2620 [Burkholderia pseudomallei 305]EDK52946.1 hypothetical protein BMAFMH_G0421 [Burkholderia mallei FMH]